MNCKMGREIFPYGRRSDDDDIGKLPVPYSRDIARLSVGGQAVLKQQDVIRTWLENSSPGARLEIKQQIVTGRLFFRKTIIVFTTVRRP
jgi:hypothetical protein